MEESLRNKETSWTWVEKSEVEGSGGTEVITDDITSEVTVMTNVKKIKKIKIHNFGGSTRKLHNNDRSSAWCCWRRH